MKRIFFAMLVLAICFSPLSTACAGQKARKALPLSSKIIAIDPGHGGYDPGTIWGDLYEKDLNLKIAKNIANSLEENGAQVILTRDGDYNYALPGMRGRQAKRYDLNQRIEIIKAHKADIVLSIHINGTRKRGYEGAETFYHVKSTNGKILALAIQQELRSIPGMTKRIAKVTDFYMVRQTKIPAVLVEVGYLSNAHERKLLQEAQYQDLLAHKITRAIIMYYNSPETIKSDFLQDSIASANYVLRVMGYAILGDGEQQEFIKYSHIAPN